MAGDKLWRRSANDLEVIRLVRRYGAIRRQQIDNARLEIRRRESSLVGVKRVRRAGDQHGEVAAIARGAGDALDCAARRANARQESAIRLGDDDVAIAAP